MWYPMGGEWVIFPILGITVMVVMLVVMLGFASRAADFGPPWMGGWGRRSHREDDALEILRRRFAAGEITTEQFESMRRQLDGR